MTLTDMGEPIDPDRKYTVGGWASVNEDVEGPAVYDLMENYISRKKNISMPQNQTVKVVGME